MTVPPTLGSLLAGSDDVTILRGKDVPVVDIVYDSRRAGAGSLFVALRGSYADGHNYLSAALDRGAAACLVDRDPQLLELDGYRAVAIAADTRRTLASVARRFYGDPSRDLCLIGITGTDGKTTTSFMVEHMLQISGLTTGLVGTIAIRVPGCPSRSAGRQTTPESLETQRLLAEMRSAGADAVILEVSSHGLETHRVDGCAFDIGVLTNITHEHLDFHGTIEAYRQAKATLFKLVDTARSDGGRGVAVVNLDDPGARSLLPDLAGLEIIGYGMEPAEGCRVAASEITPDGAGYSFTLHIDGRTAPAQIPIIGRWNVSNALAAVAVCVGLDTPLEAILDGLRTLPAVPGRMQPVSAGQPFTVVVDYAHTAPALEQVLRAVREGASGKVMVLFGSAGERDIEKRADMGAVAARFADYFIVTSEDPRFEDPDAIIVQIVDGARRLGAVEGVDFDRLEDREQAIEKMLSKAQRGDVVVLAGKGHEQSMIYGSDECPWDEAGVAMRALLRMGYSETA